MATWFTSDLHFFHGNVIRHQDRPWADAEAMNAALVRNINEAVGMNDEFYVLGDFSFKAKQAEVWELRRKILCRNIHLVRGNHDCGWNGTDAFKSVSDYLELKAGDCKLVLCHYPFLEWNGSRRGWSIHLHGHQHNGPEYNIASIEAGVLRFDVGVDANGYRPVSLDEVLEWAELARSSRLRASAGALSGYSDADAAPMEGSAFEAAMAEKHAEGVGRGLANQSGDREDGCRP